MRFVQWYLRLFLALLVLAVCSALALAADGSGWSGRPSNSGNIPERWRTPDLCHGEPANWVERAVESWFDDYVSAANLRSLDPSILDLSIRWLGEHGYLECGEVSCLAGMFTDYGETLNVLLIYPDLARPHIDILSDEFIDTGMRSSHFHFTPETVGIQYARTADGWEWIGPTPMQESGGPCTGPAILKVLLEPGDKRLPKGK